MRQRVYFDAFRGSEWPSPSELQHYFLSPAGRRRAFDTSNGMARSPRASSGRMTPTFQRTRFPTLICIALRADDGGELQVHGSLADVH